MWLKYQIYVDMTPKVLSVMLLLFTVCDVLGLFRDGVDLKWHLKYTRCFSFYSPHMMSMFGCGDVLKMKKRKFH